MAVSNLVKYCFFIVLIMGYIAIMASCKNKDIAPAAPTTTRLNVTNSSGDTIKFYVNGTRQNNTSDLFPGGSTQYLAVLSGNQTYKFSKATNGFPVFFSTQFNLDTSTYNSVFFAGETVDKAFKIVDPLADANALLAPDTTNTYAVIRFVNASPDAGPLDVTVGTGDTVNIKSIPFGTATQYMLFTRGVKTVNIYPAGSTTPELSTTITFSSGNIYTLFSKGTPNGTGTSAFGVGLTN